MFIEVKDGKVINIATYPFDGYTKEVELDFDEYENNRDKYIFNGNDFVIDPTYEERKKEKEKERIANLSMTKLDFYKYALQPNGIDYTKLQEILHTSEEMNACWQLCERVYRGDKVLCQAVEKYLPTIDLDEIFKERGQ